MCTSRFRLAVSLVETVLAVVVSAGACSNTSGLPAAHIANVVDTISLYALDGTPLSAPSGYDVESREVLRTDRSAHFDFSVNITPAGQAVLLPTGAMGLGRASGVLRESLPFDSVTIAPPSGYNDSLAVALDSGSVAVVRSRVSQCVFGAVVSFYGKVEVLRIDPVARRIDFQVLVDQNCDYRGLEPGIPRR